MWYQEYLKRLAQFNAVAFAIEFVIESYKVFRHRFNVDEYADEYADDGYDEDEYPDDVIDEK